MSILVSAAAPPESSSHLWKQIQPGTLQYIAALFPPPTLGQVFVERFIERAAREHSVLPGTRIGEVVVCAKSIALLGKDLHLSNDTTQKYVVLFRALGLLQKYTFMDQIAFVLSLGIYQPPPTLSANLDYLIERCKAKKSRSKFHELVACVKQRCLVYGLIPQDFTDSLHHLNALLCPVGSESRRKLEQRLVQAQHLLSHLMNQIMTEHLSPSQQKVDAQNLPSTPLRAEGRICDKESRSTITSISAQHNGKVTTQNLTKSLGRTDSTTEPLRERSTTEQRNGRFFSDQAKFNLPSLHLQGDSARHVVTAESTTLPQQGGCDNEVPLEKLPQPMTRVDSELTLRNVDVTNIYEFIQTFTLQEPRRVASFLAEQFEQDKRMYPKYQALLSIEKGQLRSPRAIAAAFICTMVRLHRDKWGIAAHPGGFFTKRCREYDIEIPGEVEGWITQYGHLSPARLLEILRQESIVQGKLPLQTMATPAYKPAPEPLLPPLQLEQSTRIEPERIALSREEADTLIQAIQQDTRTRLFRTQRVRLGRETPRYAVLVDATLPGGVSHQTVTYSLQDWQGRLNAIHSLRDLFYPTPTPIGGHQRRGTMQVCLSQTNGER